MGITDVTLASVPPIHRERILVAYALEISQGQNIKGMSHISPKTVKNYLRAAASHALDNGAPDPRYRYSASGHQLEGKKFFPLLDKLICHMSKWEKGRSEALPLTTEILSALSTAAIDHGPSSLQACIYDAVCLSLQSGSRCSEYCRGNPTNQSDQFCRVPNSHYAGTFAGFPIAFIAEDISFLTASKTFIPFSQAISSAAYVRVRFKFDKGGTGNLSFRTFSAKSFYQ